MPFLIRKQAPNWEADAVIDGEIAKTSLSDLRAGGKYVVIVWYPLDFTFVCPTEITAFSDRKVEFDSLNTNVAVMSVDSKFSHLAWAAMPRNKGGLGKMSIPIISDITKKISSDYGVLIEDPQDPECGVACRGTVIIDSKGTVRHVSLSDLPVGRSVDEVLRLVAAFQHSDKHGEVCPAGWKTGSKTMNADPVKSQLYFSQIQS